MSEPYPVEPPTKFTKNKTSFQLTELSGPNRRDLVNLTTVAPGGSPLSAPTFELSALGANMELSGSWNVQGYNLAHFSEVGRGGRVDTSVVVTRGYLFPLGHRAIFTNLVHRVVVADPSNAASDPANYPVAYLQSQQTMRVLQPIVHYPLPGQPFAEQTGTTDWPFVSVRMVTLTTPLLNTPDPSAYLVLGQSGTSQAIWPTYGTPATDVLWSFVGTDRAGNEVHFQMPLVFVAAYDKATAGSVDEYSSATEEWAGLYNAQTAHATWSETKGRHLQFAPDATVVTASKTTHKTLLIELGAATSATDPNATVPSASATRQQLSVAGQPNFYPVISSARVRLHAADTLTGGAFSDKRSPGDPLPDVGGVHLGYFAQYVQQGAASYGAPSARGLHPNAALTNPGSVYAQTLNSAPLNFPASAVGGIGTPNLGLSGLSAAGGALGGDLATYASTGAATLASYFPTIEAAAGQAISQLLGGLNLGDILDPSRFSTPVITSEIDPSSGEHIVTYTMSTHLTQWPTSSYPIFVPDSSDAMMNLVATIHVPGNVSQAGATTSPSYTVNGSIDPFSIFLVGQDAPILGILLLHFESVTFTAGSGAKPSVAVNIDQTTFTGCFSFVNALESFLQSLGGDGLTVDVEPTQVTVGASLSLPDVGVGMFTLSGISFGASLLIPFIDGPAVASFNFATSDAPFTLTVAMFGGGGFFCLGAGYGGIQSVQAQFEFVGQFALDVVVASGSVTLSAGIYFKYANSSVTLSAFVRITGQLSVLGIITISAEIDMTLAWVSSTGSVQGTADFHAHISVCGFGKTVSFTVSKQFAGSGGPSGASPSGQRSHALSHASPHGRSSAALDAASTISLVDVMVEDDWNSYVSAFGPPSSFV